jgi:uncharacterized integral membrane protein
MRFVFPFLVLLVVVLGALFGALNGMLVPVDFWFARVELPLGVSLLAALLTGWLAGGLVAALGRVRRPRRERAAAPRDTPANPPA